VLAEELAKLRSASRGGDRYEDAAVLFEELMAAPAFPEFLTLPAYERIAAQGA
jgi:malate synthase